MIDSIIFHKSLEELEYYSLLKIISNYAYSETTKSNIQNLVPLSEIEELKLELDYLEEMTSLLSNEDSFPFDGFEDYSKILSKSKITNVVLNTDEILDIYELISSFRRIKNYLRNINQVYPNLISLSEKIYHSKNLEKNISDIVDQNGEIKDNASPELKKIRIEINDKSNRLRDKIQKILRKSLEEEVAQDDYVTIREDRFVIPLKASSKRAYSGIIHGVSATGNTVFFEPQEIVELNNEISLLKNSEKREIYRLLEILTNQIAIDADKFLNSTSILLKYDFIHSKARYALNVGASKPIISEENLIEFHNIKHPLLVNKLGKNKVIPLSLKIDNDNKAYVISGPNAGGKTVALKTIGLSTLMACSGIFIIGEAKLSLKNVYCSIGDHQSIENDLSTFSSQLSIIKDIIDVADENSLVLIDEICSGTDPQEGSALASGIMDSFIDYGINFIVTTHQSSLKHYALNKGIVKNASLEFDDENLKPTYKFIAGLPGNSFAFNLAKSIGLNTEILKKSERYLFGDQLDIEKSIKELYKIKNKFESNNKEIQILKNKLIEKENKLNNELAKIKDKKEQVLQKSKEEAAEIVEKANRLVENTIQEIQNQKKSFSDIKKEFIVEKDQIVSDSIKKSEKVISKDQKINIGDNVYIENSESIGQVIEINNKDIIVDFNGIKIKTKLKKIIKTDSRPIEKTTKSDFKEFNLGEVTRLDLRGSRAEEAIKIIDKTISESITSNTPEITIIHGKGTGALREAIREFLKYHHLVKSFREGTLVEGGSGVTILEL